MVVAALSPLLSGCLTTYLWKDHEWEAKRVIEVPDLDAPNKVRYEERRRPNVFPSAGKILATPFTVVIDAAVITAVFGYTIWLPILAKSSA